MFFDTHAHYNDKQFDNIRDELLNSMPANNVGKIMNACAAMDELDSIIELADKYDFIYAAVGVHPSDIARLTENDMSVLAEYSKHEKVLAVGEIGLDYYYDDSPRDVQKKWFARQIELAKELKLPIIVHDREAHKDTIDILRACHAEEVGGVLHCFSGSKEMARDVLNLGMYVAFGGSVTFKNAVKPVESAAYVPLDRLLLETDAPYLTPVPFRGKLNSSIYLPYVAEKIAEIRGISAKEVENAGMENGMRLFGIKE